MWVVDMNPSIGTYEFPVVSSFEQSGRPVRICHRRAINLIGSPIAIAVYKEIRVTAPFVDQGCASNAFSVLLHDAKEPLPIGHYIGVNALIEIPAAVETLSGNSDVP